MKNFCKISVLLLLVAMMFISFIGLIIYTIIGLKISIQTGILDSSLTYSVFGFFGANVFAVILTKVVEKHINSKYNTVPGSRLPKEELPNYLEDQDGE